MPDPAAHPPDLSGTAEGVTYLVQTKTARGLTWSGLAERANMTENGLRKIREGLSQPRVATLRRLAVALDVPVAELLAAFGHDPGPSDAPIIAGVLAPPPSVIADPVIVHTGLMIALDPVTFAELSATDIAGITRQLAGYADLLIQTALNSREEPNNHAGTTAAR